MVTGVHVDAKFAGAPLIALLCEQGDEWSREVSSGENAALDLLVHAPVSVTDTPPGLVRCWQCIDGQALQETGLHPSDELGAIGA